MARAACRQPCTVVPDDVVEPVMRLGTAGQALHECSNGQLLDGLDCRHATDAENAFDATGAPSGVRPSPVDSKLGTLHPAVEHGCLDSMGTSDSLARAQGRQRNLRITYRRVRAPFRMACSGDQCSAPSRLGNLFCRLRPVSRLPRRGGCLHDQVVTMSPIRAAAELRRESQQGRGIRDVIAQVSCRNANSGAGPTSERGSKRDASINIAVDTRSSG